jgi:hypothetical protein
MSKKTVIVRMVTARQCQKCKDVEQRIIAAAKKAGVVIAMEFFDSSTNEAVELGMANGLDDVPSFVVANKPFCGISFSDDALVETMRLAK